MEMRGPGKKQEKSVNTIAEKLIYFNKKSHSCYFYV